MGSEGSSCFDNHEAVKVGNAIVSKRNRTKQSSTTSEEVRGVWLVLLFGLCQQSMLKVTSSEDEDDLFSSDEKGEHNALNVLENVWQSSPGMQVEGFLEGEEFARTALRFHLAMYLLCQECKLPGCPRTAGRWEMMR